MWDLDLLYSSKFTTSKDIKPEEMIPFPDEIHRKLINYRGQILTCAISIEDELEEILEILLNNEYLDTKRFGEKYWRLRNVDFNVKFQMLRALSESHKNIIQNEERWHELKKLISNVIRIRNCFAHGKFSFVEDNAYLTYIKSNKIEKTDELTDDYWRNLEKIFNGAFMLSRKLKKSLKLEILF